MPRRFAFEPEKGLEAILYLANRLQHPTLHSISKLLYFADQRHLSSYGRFICGDRYVAMKHGPVPSGVYDMLKWAREGTGSSHRHSEAIERALSVENGFEVRAARPANLAMLSESDTEAMDWAIQEYGALAFGELTRRSHDAAWTSADDNDMIELAAIVDQQPNARELREHLELDTGT
jgi:uncharacterized phage-associated protein